MECEGWIDYSPKAPLERTLYIILNYVAGRATGRRRLGIISTSITVSWGQISVFFKRQEETAFLTLGPALKTCVSHVTLYGKARQDDDYYIRKCCKSHACKERGSLIL